MTETLFGNLEQIAIERLQEFEKIALSKHPDGYYLAYSGGKDSDVILDLAKRSGVKFTAHHHLTTCDPPELVYHVRTHPDVEIVKPKLTMWSLIVKNKMPPMRNRRYCCKTQKENGGSGRLVVTGIRWKESRARQKRKMTEVCFNDKTKHFLNIIIDWHDNDVWEYIKGRGIKYCDLYNEGMSRVGCVLCPMKRNVAEEIARWPKLTKAWEKAVKKTFKPDDGRWESPEEYWQWWIDRDKSAMKSDENQMMFFED